MSNFSRIFVQNSATNGNAFEDAGNTADSIPDKTVQLVDVSTSETVDTSAQVGSSNDITDFDEVRLAFRDSTIGDNGLAELSPVIPVSELRVTDLSYVAPIKQQTDVTMPSSPATTEMWTLKITNLEQGHQPFPRRSYEVEVKSGDSSSDIATKFADAINNAEDQINDFNGASVSANANNAVLELTGDDVGDIFDVATRNFEADSITEVNGSNLGVGTYEQVSKYEQDDRGTLGNYVQSTNLLGSLPDDPEYADSSGEYDLLTFEFPGDSNQAVNKSIDPQYYVVALESSVVSAATEANGDASIDDFREFFDPVTVTA